MSLAVRSFVFACFVITTQGQLDTQVCRPPVSTSFTKGPQKPTFTKGFSVRVECNILNKNITTEVNEYYDEDRNRGAVQQFQSGVRTFVIFDYSTNEIIVYKPDNDNQCTIQKLSDSIQKDLFGYKIVGNKAMIYTTAGALHFGGSTIQEVWNGTATVRGTQANSYRSCQYWKDRNATMEVVWYFSDSSWNGPSGRTPVPLRCRVHGRVWVSPTSFYNFSHVYEFSEFNSTVPDNYFFETPPGTICPGRVNKKKLPKVPNTFFLGSEILVPEVYLVGYMKLYYDFNASLVRLDYRPLDLNNAPFGPGPLTEVHDYRTGVSYVIDQIHGNCSAVPISGYSIDSKFVDSHHVSVRMRNTSEIFHFNEANYVYQGTRNVRGMDCDVWAAIKKNWPLECLGVKATWEWYFATSDWLTNSGIQSEYNFPVMLEINCPQNDIHYVYQFYGYTAEEPHMWMFDISPCYNDSSRLDYQFAIPGSYKKLVSGKETKFKYAVLLTIMMYTSMSPLRIVDIRLDYGNEDVIVFFSLLAKSPVPGDVVGAQPETPLSTAMTNIVQEINHGTFYISTIADKSIRAKPYSFQKVVYEPTSPDGKYRPGDMAGMAFGMLFLGFLISCLLTLFFLRRSAKFRRVNFSQ